MTSKKNFIAVPLAAALLAAGCGGDSSDGSKPSTEAKAPSGGEVTIKAFNFKPDPVRIKRGQTVVWTNGDSTVHTVTTGARGKPDGKLDKRLAAGDGTARQRFDKPGRYRYHCSLHSGPGMEGEVIVK